MEFDFVEGLTKEQVAELYSDILEDNHNIDIISRAAYYGYCICNGEIQQWLSVSRSNCCDAWINGVLIDCRYDTCASAVYLCNLKRCSVGEYGGIGGRILPGVS